eukprot:2088337-Prymnesium_polylepis.1
MKLIVKLQGQRPKVLVVPDDSTFETLKALAAQKLGVAADGCMVLMANDEGDIADMPEVEAMEEVSNGDKLVLCPVAAAPPVNAAAPVAAAPPVAAALPVAAASSAAASSSAAAPACSRGLL